MIKELQFGQEAREKQKVGIENLAKAVRATLGPGGRNVQIQSAFAHPTITKDGVTVARAIMFEDPVENMAAQAVKDVAIKANDDAGDGTTTATVLAHAIFDAGLTHLVAKHNPVELKKGISRATEDIVKKLKGMATDVKGDFARIAQVGTVSANGEKEIGQLIANAMSKISEHGVITIEDSENSETTVEVVEGMQIDAGYLMPHFINNPQQLRCDFKYAYVILYDGELTNIKDAYTLFEKLVKTKKPIVVIAKAINGEALNTMVKNTVEASYPFCAIEAPDFGDNRQAIMEDIASLTGGRVLGEEYGTTLNEADIEEDLGIVDSIEVGRYDTTIVKKGNEKEVKRRIKLLKAQLKSGKSHEKPKIKDRIARLDGGVAVMRVGAGSKLELKEKKDRVEDALNATRAAVEEGIVPGGGVALVRAAAGLKAKGNNAAQKAGYELVLDAVRQPMWWIAQNAGANGDMVIEKTLEGKDDYGYNARTEKYGNLLDEGVIDPVKVTRVALESAASVSGSLLTTECVISFDEEKLKDDMVRSSQMR